MPATARNVPQICSMSTPEERASARRFLVAEGQPRPATVEAGSPGAAGARADMPVASDATITAWQRFCQVLMASNEFLYVD